MFLKKGTILKIKSVDELKKIKFCYNNVIINEQMIDMVKISLPIDCEIKKGFYYHGWYWYDWMFDLNDFMKAIRLNNE